MAPRFISHLRSQSVSPADVTTAPLPSVLEHLLFHPEPNHLRTGQTHSQQVLSSRSSRPIIAGLRPRQLSAADQAAVEKAADTFRSALMEKVASHPSQPSALPPAFITDFVRRVFTEDICLVDFTQALTALDYLKSMEARRKREMAAVLQRLNVDLSTFEAKRESMKFERPGVAEWLSSMTDKAKRVESLYTQVYIGLRRWALINEMRLEPFNKSNCIAILNALYPPSYVHMPTTQLTENLLNSQRSAFFRYIMAVESTGKDCLCKLEQQGKRPNDFNAWPIVREIVDKYLRTANNLIQDCSTVAGLEDFDISPISSRADSGVSFSSEPSSSGRRPSVPFLSVPKTPTAARHTMSYSNEEQLPAPKAAKEVRKTNSTLGRLTRELKRIRSRSNEDKEDKIIMQSASQASSPSRKSSYSCEHLPPTATGTSFPPATSSAPRALASSASSISHAPAHAPEPVGQPTGKASFARRSLKKMKSAGTLREGSPAPFVLDDDERARRIALAKLEREHDRRPTTANPRPDASPNRLRTATARSTVAGDRRTSPTRASGDKLRDYFDAPSLALPHSGAYLLSAARGAHRDSF